VAPGGHGLLRPREEFRVLHARHLAYDHGAGIVRHLYAELSRNVEQLESVIELVVDEEG
jgi:hypothetical protein